ncbi:hypothetical protein ACFL5R_01180 [Pseudomonadota bacterium]
MNVTYENFDKFTMDNFIFLSKTIKLNHAGKQLVEDDFNQVFHSDEARKAKNVIYIWRTEKHIPRLKGESNIIYIGQTSKSLFKRHGSSSVKVNSTANRQKYNDIIKKYGPISVSYLELKQFDPSEKTSLLKAEGQFLWWYFQNHSEYPPINYTKTKVRNNEVEFFV